ncbi:uncharacterized protein N7529_004503 [Penicillium soppii]|uniref:uncharacterized protein n=1 Tax=Penicillium soppii TaxID=69789 RepID=UPI002547F730|nr:uncharacterized protein N7529_004503 [Penicillium soppii]KAJ5872150.1 hypothetical protein N7529_004503 [Penicillium soppii]
MSGGDEQGFGVYRESLPFGRQPTAPSFIPHDLDSSFPPQAPSPYASGFVPHNHSTSTNHRATGDPLGDHREESPDPADYYRRGALSTANVEEELNNVITDMAAADYSAIGDKVSPLPTNMEELSRARRQYRSTSDSPTLGAPAAIHSLPSGARPRQTSFKDLVNKFNSTSDQLLPLPAASRTTSRTASRTASPSGSIDVEHNRILPRRRQFRESLPASITSPPRAPVDSTPSSPETDRFGPPLNVNGAIVPPPLFKRASESHASRPRVGELSPINTQLNNGILARLQRRGSDGNIPSPSPAFLDHTDQFSAKTPLTPTAWYLGHVTSLEAINVGVNNGNHRRIQSDLDQNPSSKPLAEPWNPEMAVRPLQRMNPKHGSPPDSPDSRSRIPVSSNRLATASGAESLSPSSNPTFSSRSAAILSPPKGSSRLPIPSPKYSPPRMPQDDPASFAPSSRGRRDLATGQTRNQLSESSRRLQAYIAAPPPKSSPPLRSSRPRQPVSHGASVSPRSKIGDRVSSLQKQVDKSPRSSQTRRKLPELGNVDFEARRQHIQQAINKNKHEQAVKHEQAAGSPTEIRRRPLARSETSHDSKISTDKSLAASSLAGTNAEPSDEMTTVVKESTGGVDYGGNGLHDAPRLHLNTSLPEASHTTTDSPTLGLMEGATSTNAGEIQPVNTNASNTDAPNSAITANSDNTTFDPEPQPGLQQPPACRTGLC